MEEGILKTPSIIEAFEKVDRKDFVPEELKRQGLPQHASANRLRADDISTVDGGFYVGIAPAPSRQQDS